MRQHECNLYAGLGYVIGYNFTALHASVRKVRSCLGWLPVNLVSHIAQLFIVSDQPLYQKLADEALLREAFDDDRYHLSANIHPLPRTNAESRYSEADDVFNLWFMVVL